MRDSIGEKDRFEGITHSNNDNNTIKTAWLFFACLEDI
jgi:hypothetical protein